MRRLIRIFPVLLAAALVAVVLTAPGQGRSSDIVTCSSKASLPAKRDLTGTWLGSDRRSYVIRQIGTCVWWAGSSSAPEIDGSKAAENVFFGAVSSSGSTVFGLWADLRSTRPRTGRVVLTVQESGSSRKLVKRGSGARFPARTLTLTK
jgi:hypothetical protein